MRIVQFHQLHWEKKMTRSDEKIVKKRFDLNLRSMMSLFKAVIEKVKFFFAVSSLRISVHPVLTRDSELAAVSFTLPIRSIK